MYEISINVSGGGLFQPVLPWW